MTVSSSSSSSIKRVAILFILEHGESYYEDFLTVVFHQGMSYAQLAAVTYSIIISGIIYALPAWGGFLSTELVGKINALFRRLKRFGYLSCNITVSDLMADCDIGLFRHMYSPSHCLHHMLSCPRVSECVVS